MSTDLKRTRNLFSKMSVNKAKQRSMSNVAAPPRKMHHFLVSGHRFDVDTFYKPNIAVGNGAYGVVCSAVDSRYSMKVAIKKCTNAFDDIIDGKRILREIKLLQFFEHDNIIKMHDVVPPASVTDDNTSCSAADVAAAASAAAFRSFSDVYMVLEHMESDLHKIIYSRNKLTDEHYQYFIHQLLLGLNHMHSCKVIHRDLKPSNLLVNSDCKLKICDFGLARGLDWNPELTEYVVTRWYRAPEIMCSCQDYNEKIDIWAVATILGEMIFRKPMFAGDHYIHQLNLIFDVIGTPRYESDLECVSNNKALKYIQKLKTIKRKDFDKHFKDANPLAVDFFKKTLLFNPNKRMSVDDCLKHPYFAKLHTAEKFRNSVCTKPTISSAFEKKCGDRKGLKEQTLSTLIDERRNANHRWGEKQANSSTKRTVQQKEQ